MNPSEFATGSTVNPTFVNSILQQLKKATDTASATNEKEKPTSFMYVVDPDVMVSADSDLNADLTKHVTDLIKQVSDNVSSEQTTQALQNVQNVVQNAVDEV